MAQGVRKPVDVGAIGGEDVKSDPLGTFGPDPRQSGEFVDQLLDGSFEHRRSPGLLAEEAAETTGVGQLRQ